MSDDSCIRSITKFKINKVMARKKKEEQQSVTAEVVETKKKSPKKKKVVEEVVEIPQKEPELMIEEDASFLSVEDDSPLAKDYSIEELFAALDEPDENNNEEESLSDEILDNFDRTLEEKGLGENYFRKKEERLKEMELEHELHEFEIDKMLSEEV